jgi:hypothetical protein
MQLYCWRAESNLDPAVGIPKVKSNPQSTPNLDPHMCNNKAHTHSVTKRFDPSIQWRRYPQSAKQGSLINWAPDNHHTIKHDSTPHTLTLQSPYDGKTSQNFKEFHMKMSFLGTLKLERRLRVLKINWDAGGTCAFISETGRGGNRPLILASFWDLNALCNHNLSRYNECKPGVWHELIECESWHHEILGASWWNAFRGGCISIERRDE